MKTALFSLLLLQLSMILQVYTLSQPKISRKVKNLSFGTSGFGVVLFINAFEASFKEGLFMAFFIGVVNIVSVRIILKIKDRNSRE